MRTMIAICLFTLLLAGCGVFKHQQQTYYVEEVLKDGVSQPKPILHVQIVPTVESTHIPLIYYSRRWVGPYSISFSSDSEVDDCTHFLLHSLRLTSDEKLVEEKLFATPVKLDVCDSKTGTRGDHTLYGYQLDDSFKFVEGRMVELEVTYERPDGQGVRAILLQGVGEQRKSNTSLFTAYMGV